MQNIFVKFTRFSSQLFLPTIVLVVLGFGLINSAPLVNAQKEGIGAAASGQAASGQAAIGNSNSGGGSSASLDIPKIKNPFGDQAQTLPGIFNRIINIILGLIVIAAVVVIIISGFRMVAGGGNPDQVKKAKTGIIWALIGLVVAFMSFAIVSIVQKIL